MRHLSKEQPSHTTDLAGSQVILKTTLGDIDVELWPKEAPKACSSVAHALHC